MDCKNNENETFSNDSKHNCYPYSANLNAKNSYNSLLKGWCGDIQPYSFSNIFNFNLSEDIDKDYNLKSNEKCGESYSRVSPNTSHKLKSKSWCVKREL